MTVPWCYWQDRHEGTSALYIENGSCMRDTIKLADHDEETRIILEWI